ncbi:suppressor protein SRP40-like [Camellia sinensis]|uniref:suppressor protein SRP40-like n=1 Tax=Camellia sinensis TaxID=4442 RepID=UPI0010362986|nr:suppressor protein SRP40-like [Camellia sinensis]
MPPLTGARARDVAHAAEVTAESAASAIHIAGTIGVRRRPPWIGRFSSLDGANEGNIAYHPWLSASFCASGTNSTSSTSDTSSGSGKLRLAEETSSSSDLVLSGDDDKTSSPEEIANRHSKSEKGDDDAGSKLESGEEAETDSGSGSGEDDVGSSSKSHPSDDSGADGDSAPESPLRKKTLELDSDFGKAL